ncbi:serine/threonine-protein kinase fray2-like [Electrophorus electricus]|uniref:serine/threonine-protein kinase fray2-like n=1 Tax=Electrophorus electricus TaxID=8005 RepID=UPI0015D054D2|nr:serine/threonine-protein kinase fray2-like [Electrophorus electricus]
MDQWRRRDGHGSLYRYPEYYPAETSRSRAPESYHSDNTRGRHEGKGRRPEHYPSEGRTKYPEEYLSERNRHVEAEYTERRRHKTSQLQDQLEELYDQNPMASTKEKTPRDDPAERDKMWDKERDRARRRDRDREREMDGKRTRDEVQYRDEDRSQTKLLVEDSSRDRNDHRHGSRDSEFGRERDRRGQKDAARDGGRDRDQDKHRSKDRGRGREPVEPTIPTSRGWLEEGPEDEGYGGRQKLSSDLDDVFGEPHPRAQSGEARSPGHSSKEQGMEGGPWV